jgi:hypothetical protein
MRYLVHCILRNRLSAVPDSRQNNVRFVANGGLAAAFTRVENETAAPDTSRLLAYESVISALHASSTVIPLRYGCLVEDESQIGRLLDERRLEYEGLLDRLEDRVEMGLRVLWETRAESQDIPPPATPGAAYLAEIRKRHDTAMHFNNMDLNSAELAWAGRLCACLAGLYSEDRREARPTIPGCVVSLYFLVPRAAVPRFRGKLRRVLASEGRRFLVSGPWPPYNFVMPEMLDRRRSGA